MIRFEKDSPFVTEDNRSKRKTLPTSAESLNRKHEFLLPMGILYNKSVLDLGACIGATGQWVLSNRALKYTGVEVQEPYIEIGKRLLKPWGDKAVISSQLSMEKHDIVTLLGLLHCVENPVAWLMVAVNLAEEYICVEDQGTGEALVPIFNDRMAIASTDSSRLGFGWKIGKVAVERYLKLYGFTPDGGILQISKERWAQRFKKTFNGEAATIVKWQ